MKAMQATLTEYITTELLMAEDDFELTAEDDLLTTGLIDSLGVMQLINFVDETFMVSVAPEDVTIENFQTVNAIASYVARRSEQQQAA